MAEKNYAYVGKGTIYSGPKGGAKKPMGNVSALSFAVSTNRISQPDYRSPGGGEAAALERVDSVTGSMTVLNISPKNLALGYRGTTRDVVGGTAVSDERHTAYPGALVDLDDLPDRSDTANTVVVTMDPDGTPTVLTEGTDYEVKGAGILFLDTSTNVTDDVAGHAVGIDYEKSEASVMEALVEAGEEFAMVFDGLNEADSGKAVSVKVHRLTFSPTSGSSFIGDEFAELPIEFSCLSDDSISGTGISKFFKVAMQA